MIKSDDQGRISVGDLAAWLKRTDDIDSFFRHAGEIIDNLKHQTNPVHHWLMTSGTLSELKRLAKDSRAHAELFSDLPTIHGVPIQISDRYRDTRLCARYAD